MFSKVNHQHTLKGPAKVNLVTRELTINPAYFGTLQSHEKKFVLLHEAGHLANQNKSETAADFWALKNAHLVGLSPKAAILAITSTLDNNRPDHVHRANQLFKQYQKMKNKNLTANYVGDDYAEAPFIGKALKKLSTNYKNNKTAKREDKQAFKLAKIDAKAQGRALVASNRTGGGITDQITSVLGGLLGGNSGGGYDASGVNPGGAYTDEQPKDNTMLYVWLAVAAIVLFVVAKKQNWF